MKSCIFCNRNWHKSKDCDEYKTEEDRKKCPNSERFCFCCFVVSDAAHYPWDQKCGSNDKCDAWNSSYHHTLFCKARLETGIEAYNLFLPHIDQDLLPRFFKTLEAEEKYFMLLSSLNASNLVNINNIKIMDAYDSKKFEKCSNSDLIVIQNLLRLSSANDEKDKKLFDSIRARIVYLPSKICLYGYGLSSDNLLQLLSPSTKKFKVYNSGISPKLSFTEIIKKAPNLEKICIDDTIHPEDSWLQALLKYKTGEKMKSLSLMTDKVEFNIEDMVKFIKKKCCKNVKIYVSFPTDDNDEDGQAFYDFGKELDEYFEYDRDAKESGELAVGYDGVDGTTFYTLGRIKKPKKKRNQNKLL